MIHSPGLVVVSVTQAENLKEAMLGHRHLYLFWSAVSLFDDTSYIVLQQ